MNIKESFVKKDIFSCQRKSNQFHRENFKYHSFICFVFDNFYFIELTFNIVNTNNYFRMNFLLINIYLFISFTIFLQIDYLVSYLSFNQYFYDF